MILRKLVSDLEAGLQTQVWDCFVFPKDFENEIET